MKNRKSRIWLSGLSLVVCVAMLAGATFAWFSDTSSNKGNRIQAGTLSVDLLKHDGTNYVSIAGGAGDIFNDAGNGSNWEPGRSETVYLQVKNTGSLELKYNLDIKVLDDGLADVLELSVANPYNAVTGGTPAFASLGTVSSLMTGDVITLAQKGELAAAGTSYTKGSATVQDAEFIAIKVKMLESAGNTYQGLSFAADVFLTATQTNKGDGDDYDKDATLKKVWTAADLAAAPENATAVLMNDITLTTDVAFSHFVNIDYAGHTLDLGGYTLTITDTAKEGSTDLGTAQKGGDVKNGTIEINTPKGTVNAYGIYAADVTFDIVAVASHSFNLFGVIAGSLSVGGGRAVIQPGAFVNQITGGQSSVIVNHGTVATSNVPVENNPASNATILYGTSLKNAVTAAAADTTLYLMPGTYFFDSAANNFKIQKNIAIKGAPGALVKVSGTGGLVISGAGAGTLIEGVAFEKTDKVGDVLSIQSNNVTVRNCTFTGQYKFGNGEVARAGTISAVANFTFEGNTVKALRQPLYINPSSGVVKNNFVEGTRGFVVCGDSSVTFSGNEFKNNAVDIAIITNSPIGPNQYTDKIAEISAANNGALVEDQYTTPKTHAIAGRVVTQTIEVTPADAALLYQKVADAPAGSLIILKEGTYVTATVIQVGKTLALRGEGKVIIKKTDSVYSKSNRQLFTASGGATIGSPTLEGIYIENITFDTNHRAASDAQGTYATSSVNLISVRAILKDVTAINATASGVTIQGKYAPTEVTAIRLISRNNAWHGVDVTSSASGQIAPAIFRHSHSNIESINYSME